MDQSKFLKEQNQTLKNQIIEARKQIERWNNEIESNNNKMANLYKDCFDNKKSKQLVMYNRFPSFELLKLYTSRINDEHPMNEYGNFDITELAEIIKLLYQYQRKEDFHILTVGKVDEHGVPVYQGQVFNLVPQLFFIIGNERSIEKYIEYDGKFINENNYFDFEYFKQKMNITALSANRLSFNDKKLNIECLCDSYKDINNKINYFDYLERCYDSCSFSSRINIYNSYLKTILYNYKGIKDVLGFNLNINDSFIAKILISISIYKRNNNIKELSKDDYYYIFNTIFGKNIDIYNEIEKDIPKSLKYVPNSKCKY
jgi:hypothetical protein